jgi:predicted kinase
MLFRAGKRQKPLDHMYRQLKKKETPVMRMTEYQQLRRRAKLILEDGYRNDP